MNYSYAFLYCFVIVLVAWVFFTINIIKYKWYNGELKVRIALQIWSIGKMGHLIATYDPNNHYLFLAVSLTAITYIAVSRFLKKPYVSA